MMAPRASGAEDDKLERFIYTLPPSGFVSPVKMHRQKAGPSLAIPSTPFPLKQGKINIFLLQN